MSERLVSAMNGSCARLAFKIFSPDALPEVQSCADNSNRVLTERLPVILLHGITSVKEAWDNCGAAIANRIRTKVYSLDARNHGESEWTDKIDFIKMADDVAGFMDSMAMPKAILIGHSMGGKTAMCFALRHTHRLHTLIIEDMKLSTSQSDVDVVQHYFVLLKEVLHKIPPDTDLLRAKRIAARYLTSGGQEEAIKTENLTSLNGWDGRDLPLRLKPGGGYEWKLNLDAIQASVSKDEFTPPNLLEGTGKDPETIYEGPVLLIYGTRSSMNVPSDKELILKKFPNTVFEPIVGESHSIHREHTKIFLDLVCDFILKHLQIKPHF